MAATPQVHIPTTRGDWVVWLGGSAAIESIGIQQGHSSLIACYRTHISNDNHDFIDLVFLLVSWVLMHLILGVIN